MNINIQPKQPHTNAMPQKSAQGFSLIELMIAMVLGLFVIGGVISVFVANQQTARTTESLSRIQESARLAFELLARSIREADGSPCIRTNPVVNVVNPDPNFGWVGWPDGGIRGYSTDAAFNAAFPAQATGTDAADHIAGTNAITLTSGGGSNLSIVDHNPTAAQFKVSTVNHDLQDGDIAMVCDLEVTSIFQITNAQPGTNDTVVHNTGVGTPGNCTKGLGFPLQCTTLGTPHTFGPNSQIVHLLSTTWYIGASGRNDARGNPINALFRIQNGGVPAEIAEGVDDMQITYLVNGSVAFIAAPAAIQWPDVTSLRIALTLSGVETGTRTDTANNNRLGRTLTQVVTVRNHAP
jgi:type IV pilus assembly protein PilW